MLVRNRQGITRHHWRYGPANRNWSQWWWCSRQLNGWGGSCLSSLRYLDGLHGIYWHGRRGGSWRLDRVAAIATKSSAWFNNFVAVLAIHSLYIWRTYPYLSIF